MITGRVCVIGSKLANESADGAVRSFGRIRRPLCANTIPMYVFTGFLESGKTKFIQETLGG